MEGSTISKQPRLLVLGGSGFIGRAICREAIRRGCSVTSVSRYGPPDGRQEPWTGEVEWVRADIFNPAQWRASLNGCTGLVHCVGIRKEGPGKGHTFERMNVRSAALSCTESERAGVRHFIFMSSGEPLPPYRGRYIPSMRQAENEVLARDLDAIIMRPDLAYGPGRWSGRIFGAVLETMTAAGLFRETPPPFRPLPVEVVARAAVRALLAPEVTGILETDQIEVLGREESAGGPEGQETASSYLPHVRARPTDT
jgi:uncharacterized protein YbjT (DUF2867 family)